MMDAVLSQPKGHVDNEQVLNRRGGWLVAAREIIREACFGLYHHRFRAALSMLGICAGRLAVAVRPLQ